MKYESPFAQTQCVLREIETLLGKTTQTQAWQNRLVSIEERLQESVLRLAVVGTVKSGKSSFINALLGRDVLKRGAGILTSTITRIRSGTTPCAHIHFKSWKTIIAEIEESFALLALSAHQVPPSVCPNFRSLEGRETLNLFLKKHPQHFSQTGDSFKQEYSLLLAYLEGYDSIQSYLLEEEDSSLSLESEDIVQHQAFVALDAHAVYMKDIMLELDFPSMFSEKTNALSLELADCQGCDSPNPMHLARVQEYISQSSLIVYVISSRTGIRQGDLILLRSLQQLNMLQQTLFVFNTDLEEHESLQDCLHLLERTRNLLKEWTPDPVLCSFSVLFQLLSCKEQSSEKCTSMEQMRLTLWKETSPLLQSHHEGWEKLYESLGIYFKSTAHHALQQGELLHWKSLIQQISEGLQQISVLTQKAQKKQIGLEEKTALSHQQLFQVISSFESTAEGAQNRWKQKIKDDVNALFEDYSGSWVNRLKFFVMNYQPSPTLSKKYETNTEQKILTLESEQWGLSYLIEGYQDLRQQLLAFMTQEINATLLHALKALREQYLKEVKEVCAPFIYTLQTASQQRHEVEGFLEDQQKKESYTLLESLSFSDTPLIPFSLSLQYQTPQKLQSFYVLGKSVLQHQFTKWRTKSLKKDSLEYFLQQSLLKKLRQEALESLEFDLLNYQENLKYRYLYRGIVDLMESLQTELRQHGESAIIDYENLYKHLEDSGAKHSELLPHFNSLIAKLQNLSTDSLEVSQNQ